MAPEIGQSLIVLATVWHDSCSCVENLLLMTSASDRQTDSSVTRLISTAGRTSHNLPWRPKNSFQNLDFSSPCWCTCRGSACARSNQVRLLSEPDVRNSALRHPAEAPPTLLHHLHDCTNQRRRFPRPTHFLSATRLRRTNRIRFVNN